MGQIARKPFRKRFSSVVRSSQWLTYGLSAVALAAAGIPLVGYFVGVRKRKEIPWVNLGPVDRFPVNETRLKNFDNPLRVPGTA